MRNLVFAVAITFGASALLFLVATVVGLPAEAAKGVAGVPALAIKSIYDFLETQSAKRNLAHAKSLVSFEEFAMHPLSLFILAVILYMGILAVTTFLTGFLVAFAVPRNSEFARSQPVSLLNVISVTALPLNVIGIGYVGRWIGYRSRPLRGLAVAIATVVIGGSASLLLSFTTVLIEHKLTFINDILTDQVLETFTGGTNTITLKMFVYYFIGSTWAKSIMFLYIISIALGVWWGLRRQLARYLVFILKVLPQETREAIVEIARDEALRISTPGREGTREAVRV
jgi:hypothetical protein